jgi:hypothetical protein
MDRRKEEIGGQTRRDRTWYVDFRTGLRLCRNYGLRNGRSHFEHRITVIKTVGHNSRTNTESRDIRSHFTISLRYWKGFSRDSALYNLNSRYYKKWSTNAGMGAGM